MKDKYSYRASGNYWIRRHCENCGLEYDVHALQNTPADGEDLCGECREKKEASK